ncbi:MAG TPA: gluconate 2-dehydrogenase subunit 3 family protein [Thauera sp.]|nr:gluconate 2-dehydrogenase subunit 3 family protein [Thauera sp.]
MENATRRDFVKTLGICLVAVGIPRPLTALAAARAHGQVSFDATEWRCVEAICADIIPADQDPGATEGNCTNFIDKALSAEDSLALPLYRDALAAIDGLCLKAHGRVFADLAAPDRAHVLNEMAQGTLAGWTETLARPQDFFATVRFHTLLGFISDPKYGGNDNYVGWKLMGFPGPMHEVGGVSPEQMLGQKPVVPIWEVPGHAEHNKH